MKASGSWKRSARRSAIPVTSISATDQRHTVALQNVADLLLVPIERRLHPIPHRDVAPSHAGGDGELNGEAARGPQQSHEVRSNHRCNLVLEPFPTLLRKGKVVWIGADLQCSHLLLWSVP
jgi:hypothetical protein